MNSAPACIILEQLRAHGAELGGGRGDSKEGGEQQPYQHYNGSAVWDVGLLDWEKRNYRFFCHTLIFFSSLPLYAASRLQVKLADTFHRTSWTEVEHEKEHMVRRFLLHGVSITASRHIFEHLPLEI